MKRIAVLKGGWSSEKEVSLDSASAVTKALIELGYTVIDIPVKRDLEAFVELITKADPDIIFNALHGTGGEDGVIQGVLEMLNIPYTHCGVTASALAMNKALSRQIFSSVGIRIAQGRTIKVKEWQNKNPLPFPYVIKPIAEGSSQGVKLIFTDEDRIQAYKSWSSGAQALVEEYIPGRELNVTVLDGKAIGCIEIEVAEGYYDYEAKYTLGRAKHIMPAPLSGKQEKEIFSLAECAYEALGCQSICRADFRFNGENFYILEMNTQPGMTDLSLVPETVAHYGMTFKDLVKRILNQAMIKG